jgi:redox-sensitive bicupin YhaK (pirin superfamily)
MPKGDEAGRMHGFQMWGNLSSSLKMTAPRYQEVKGTDIPKLTDDDGTHVRVVCGNFWGMKGPVDGVAADPIYLDVSLAAGRRKTLPVETTRHAFAYVFAGSGKFCNASEPLAVPTEPVGWLDTKPPSHADNRSLVLFDRAMKSRWRLAKMASISSRVGKAARRAGSVVRSDRDEHARATSASVSGT